MENRDLYEKPLANTTIFKIETLTCLEDVFGKNFYKDHYVRHLVTDLLYKEEDVVVEVLITLLQRLPEFKRYMILETIGCVTFDTIAFVKQLHITLDSYEGVVDAILGKGYRRLCKNNHFVYVASNKAVPAAELVYSQI